MRLTRTLPCQAEAILKTRDDDTQGLAVLWLPLQHNTGCKMRLMLLEDDATLGEGLRDFLQAEGHHVDWSRTLHEARTWDDGAYDALLVDWQLPDGSGVDWVKALRRQGDVRPIVVLTARDLLADRLQGLDAGADDYLVKPFEPEELVARLHAIRRRAGGGMAPQQVFGKLVVDVSAKAASLRSADGQLDSVTLTAREWAVLEALVTRAGRIVPKSDLESLVLGSAIDVASNTLEVHVANLRRKLGRHVVETVRGMGYKMGQA